MPPRAIFICVETLSFVSDSIGYDAVYQWTVLRDLLGGEADLRIFSRSFKPELYPGVPIEPIRRFWPALAENPDATVIYHFCDGWKRLEAGLLAARVRNLIIRWHNNTPPWFVAKYARRHFEGTVNGFTTIIRLGRETTCRFWCNSDFTAQQLAALGIERERAYTVFPASRYLGAIPAPIPSRGRKAAPPNILFVSRIVPHKGHRHVILAAAYARRFLDLPTQIVFPGRFDKFVMAYRDELIDLARRLDVPMELPDGVDDAQLDRLYRDADLFLCLSEHEGFGLPIFEAMRLGVPVAAWQATALADAMAGHPLSSPHLSPRWFAAALAALQSPSIRDGVIRWQNENALPRYTKEVIASQLHTAIGRTPSTLQAMPDPVIDPGLESAIHAEITRHLARIGAHRIAEEVSIPHEIAGNFVTLYDIEAARNVRRIGRWRRAIRRGQI